MQVLRQVTQVTRSIYDTRGPYQTAWQGLLCKDIPRTKRLGRQTDATMLAWLGTKVLADHGEPGEGTLGSGNLDMQLRTPAPNKQHMQSLLLATGRMPIKFFSTLGLHPIILVFSTARKETRISLCQFVGGAVLL